MTEWRRTLKSWPKETLQTADAASLPSWVGEAAKHRQESRDPKAKRTASLWLLAIGGFVLGFIILLGFLPTSDPRTLPAIVVALGAATVVFITLGRFLERTEARRRLQATERLEALGESTLGGDYVGVSYADGGWTYPGLERNLDEGVLRIDLDRLTFVGRETRFDLPAEAIVGTELRRQETALGNQARIYVEWAYGGQKGTLSLGFPYRRSLRRRVTDATDLRDRIERWRGEPFPRRSTLPLLPPMLEPKLAKKPDVRVGLMAKVLSGTVIFAGSFAVIAAFELGRAAIGLGDDFGRHVGSVFTMLSFVWFLLWMMLAAKIESRLPERYRYRPKTGKGVRDALRTVEGTHLTEPEPNARSNH